MKTCDRQQFIDCTKGILLKQKKGVITHLGDGASESVISHNKGEKIGLLVKGKLFSVIENYIETKV